MQYLNKSFTIAMGGFGKPKRSKTERPVRTQTKGPHKYRDVGGMCYHCTLDRIGHDAKFGKGETA
jgi:hypothetical protein